MHALGIQIYLPSRVQSRYLLILSMLRHLSHLVEGINTLPQISGL